MSDLTTDHSGGAPETKPANPHVMGHEGEHSPHENEHVRQQPDQPDSRKIFAIAVAGIAITVGSIFISYAFQLKQEAGIPAAPTPAAVSGTYQAQGNHGMIERDLFVDRQGEAPDGDAQHLKRDKDVQLSTYGWVDRPRGIIRIPIEKAMEQVVSTYGQRR